MFYSLQAFRGFAAIFVVLFHIGKAFALDKYFDLQVFSSIFEFGDSGVEFFFVLSGFVIFWAHRKDFGCPDRLARYTYNRFVRLYPFFWLCFLPLSLLVFSSYSSGLGTVSEWVLALFLITPTIIDDHSSPVVLPVAWSLHYELFFYFLFGLFILNRSVGTIFISVVVVVGMLLDSFGFEYALLDFLLSQNVILFVFGVFVAFLVDTNLCEALKKYSFLFLFCCCFIYIFVVLVDSSGLLDPFSTLTHGAASALLVLGLVLRESDGGVVFLKSNWLGLLGRASYAIYLTHYPIVSLYCKVSVFFKVNEVSFFLGWIHLIACLILSLGVGLVVHSFVERPILIFFKKNRVDKSLGS